MRRLQLRDVKANLSAVVDEAIRGKPAVITRHGRPEAVILSFAEWNRLSQVPSFGRLLMAAPLADVLFQGIYQGIIALVLSMWLYTRVVQAFGATRTAMVTALCPGLAALSGIFMLGEPLSMPVLLGLASVTVGMIVGVTGQGAANVTRPSAGAPTAVR